MVQRGNFIKLTIAAEMIEVRVGVENYHRFVSYLGYCLTQVSNSAAGVDQGSRFWSDKETDGSVFVVPSFTERKEIVGNLIDLGPILGNENLLQTRILSNCIVFLLRFPVIEISIVFTTGLRADQNLFRIFP